MEQDMNSTDVSLPNAVNLRVAVDLPNCFIDEYFSTNTNGIVGQYKWNACIENLILTANVDNAEFIKLLDQLGIVEPQEKSHEESNEPVTWKIQMLPAIGHLIKMLFSENDTSSTNQACKVANEQFITASTTDAKESSITHDESAAENGDSQNVNEATICDSLVPNGDGDPIHESQESNVDPIEDSQASNVDPIEDSQASNVDPVEDSQASNVETVEDSQASNVKSKTVRLLDATDEEIVNGPPSKKMKVTVNKQIVEPIEYELMEE